MNTETLKISLIQQILQKYALLLQKTEAKQAQQKAFFNAFFYAS